MMDPQKNLEQVCRAMDPHINWYRQSQQNTGGKKKSYTCKLMCIHTALINEFDNVGIDLGLALNLSPGFMKEQCQKGSTNV